MHIRKPPDRPRRKEIPPRSANKTPVGKMASILVAMTPVMHKAAAAFLFYGRLRRKRRISAAPFPQPCGTERPSHRPSRTQPDRKRRRQSHDPSNRGSVHRIGKNRQRSDNGSAGENAPTRHRTETNPGSNAGSPDSRIRQGYETLTVLTVKSRNTFVQSYSTLISENPAIVAILSLPQSLCEPPQTPGEPFPANGARQISAMPEKERPARL